MLSVNATCRARTGAGVAGNAVSRYSLGSAEVPPERPRENLVAGETFRGRDREHGIITARESRGGALQTKPQRVLLRGFADYLLELSMKVERRPARLLGERPERDILIQPAAKASQQVHDVALRWHQYRNDRLPGRQGLMFLAVTLLPLTARAQMSLPKLGVAGGIAAIAGTVALLCIPAVFYLEARSQPDWPAHVTQAVAALVCAGASAVFSLISPPV